MTLLKWICFIIVCLDFIGYIIEKSTYENDSKARNLGEVLGLILGTIARVFVLYGTATCWLLV